MIGNDVIDLKINLKEDKASNIRYLKKICSDSEIEAIQLSNHPNLLLWRIWSMKESAYKIVAKKTGIRLFIPKRLETFIENEHSGRVISEWGTFYASSLVEVEKGVIATHAFDEIDAAIYTKFESIEPKMDASLEVRKLLLKTLCEQLASLNPDTLELKMQGAIPLVFEGKAHLPICVSLSHHGCWIACAFELEDDKI